MKHKLLLLYTWFIRTMLFFFPDIPFFMAMRGYLYGLGMKKCGKNVQITHDALIKELENISCGNNVFVGNNSIIMGSANITISDQVLIAPHCIIVSGNHTLIDASYRYGNIDSSEIFIGRGAWIAANCTIAKGSFLPESSVLGANSFLNRNFHEKCSLYAGVPAIMIKKN